MATYRLSRLAEADLMEIGAYTLNTWGEEQAIRYLNSLEACCQQQAEQPETGRACEQLRPGLRRIDCARHVIFYRVDTGGIVVSRILHRRMLAERHTLEE